tara:strand:+ start:799 stop:1380 length:582 start_codon:yes stop_codon:yes gene_type:complete
MKLILENWRQYLEEGATFPTTVFHGSPDDFDFINDFRFGDEHNGVGALYTFFTPEPAKEFALLHADHNFELNGREGWVYEINLKPGASIIDLTDFSGYGEKHELIKQHIMASAAAADGPAWEDLVGCKGAPCIFDFLDYNIEFVQFLSDIGVDGLIFIDGLDEIGIDQIKILAMFNTKPIKEVRKAKVSEKRN